MVGNAVDVRDIGRASREGGGDGQQDQEEGEFLHFLTCTVSHLSDHSEEAQ